MFTGIVEELAEVVSVRPCGDTARLWIRGPGVAAGARSGDSIAVDGVCLTVVEVADQTFGADVMRVTLDRSSLASLRPGAPANLERPLTLESRLGGHLVQGHVDGVGELIERRPGAAGDGEEHRWELVRFSLPDRLHPYIVSKGSLAVDGVSLTVVDIDDGAFTVGLVPATLKRTTLGYARVGDLVNLEVDMVAKYIERQIEGHIERHLRQYLERDPDRVRSTGAPCPPGTETTNTAEGGS